MTDLVNVVELKKLVSDLKGKMLAGSLELPHDSAFVFNALEVQISQLEREWADDDDGSDELKDYKVLLRIPSRIKISAKKIAAATSRPDVLLADAFRKLQLMASPKLFIPVVPLEHVTSATKPGPVVRGTCVEEIPVQFRNWRDLTGWLIIQPEPKTNSELPENWQ